MSNGGSPYRRHKNDVESAGAGSGGFEDYESTSGPFDIVSTKSASVDRLKRWRVNNNASFFNCFFDVSLFRIMNGFSN